MTVIAAGDALEECILFTRHDDDRPPDLRRRQLGVEREASCLREHARGRFGALEISPEPEAMVGDPRDHAVSFITHVSLLPPPCEELTT